MKWRKDTPAIVELKRLAGVEPKSGFDKFKDSVNNVRTKIAIARWNVWLHWTALVHKLYYGVLKGKNQKLHEYFLVKAWNHNEK